jgi:hypothetical protein
MSARANMEVACKNFGARRECVTIVTHRSCYPQGKTINASKTELRIKPTALLTI